LQVAESTVFFIQAEAQPSARKFALAKAVERVLSTKLVGSDRGLQRHILAASPMISRLRSTASSRFGGNITDSLSLHLGPNLWLEIPYSGVIVKDNEVIA